jgi:uncharacterized protein (TIGR02246 family)
MYNPVIPGNPTFDIAFDHHRPTTMNCLIRPVLSASLLVPLLLATACGGKGPASPDQASPTGRAKPLDQQMLRNFADGYTKAWNSRSPELFASQFATDGIFIINNNAPARGRAAIAKVVQGFMSTFPDMALTMDTLVAGVNGAAYHWTLTGTNSGPGGNGNTVRINGVEVWQLNDVGQIRISDVHFDKADYDRQLGLSADH